MNAAAEIIRARQNNVAMHGLYEVSKLFAAQPPRARALPEVLNLLCNFWELSDAGIALGDATADPELIRAERCATLRDEHLPAVLREACRRARVSPTPWVVESEWCEPALRNASLSRRDTDLDRSFVVVPIKRHGGVEGVLCVERLHGPGDQVGFCFDADVRALSAIANMIAFRVSDRGRSAQRLEEARAPAELDAAPSHGSRTVGDHPRWRATLHRACTAAKSSSTILLRGASGTGKELLATFIHETSPRRTRPFVSVNCAALAESVLESELFGHEKGAFTGATALRKGRFELAHGGTLFLDEIGEISGAFQARLLRVLQLGEFERVGGMTTLKVDVRIIAATHRNLEQEVRSGRFRADLYYRLSVVPVLLPSLRERASDIAPLAQAFLARFNKENGTHLTLHPSALKTLVNYPFPGNVRELENGICRAATLATSDVLTSSDFDWLAETLAELEAAHLYGGAAEAALDDALPETSGHATVDPELGVDVELCGGARDRLLSAMERAGWVQAKAARLLGLTPRQIAYALRKHQIPMRRL